jgi:anthranilate phosphoribosyltransferase
LSPGEFHCQPSTLADLTGGNARDNAMIVRQILDRTERGPKRDAVLLNSAAALWVAGRTRSPAEGWNVAEETIDSGAALAQLDRLIRAGAG